jgi:hypothetical protein
MRRLLLALVCLASVAARHATVAHLGHHDPAHTSAKSAPLPMPEGRVGKRHSFIPASVNMHELERSLEGKKTAKSDEVSSTHITAACIQTDN